MQGIGRSDRDRSLAVGVFFLALAVYLVTYSGGFKSNDERALFAGTDSFVKRGAFTIDQIYWDYTHVGMLTTTGEMVPNYEPAQMVLAIPLYLWGRALGAAAQGVMFWGALVSAAAAGLLYLCLVELGFGRRTSLFGAGVFAFATLAWPYSRTFFREPLTTLAYLVTFYALLRYAPPGPRRPGWAALAGTALGIAVANKQTSVAIVPGLLLLLAAYEWRRPGTWRERLVPALAALAPLALILALYRAYYVLTLSDVSAFARNVGEYATNPQLSTSKLGQMVYAFLGITISPYKGLFWYAPALLLGLAGAWSFVRRRRWEGLAILLIIAAHLAGYSRYLYWSGGVAWGSRYMLVLCPFFVLLAAPVLTWLLREPTSETYPPESAAAAAAARQGSAAQFLRLRPLAWVGTTALLAVSTGIQVLGVSLDVRLYELQFQLGQAKIYGGIGEAIQALYMVPRFSPVVGHFNLLRSGAQPLDFAWIQLRPEGKWTWLPLGMGLSLAAVIIALAALVWLWRRPRLAKPLGVALGLGAVVLCSGLLLMYRHGDARYDPYDVGRFLRPLDAALQQAVAASEATCCRTSSPGTPACSAALVVPDTVLTDYFLNYLAAPLPWYDVEPRPVPQALLDQLLARYATLYVARDRSAAADDQEGRRGVERYLADQAYKVGEQQFGDWARLVRFSAPGALAEQRQPGATLGDMELAQVTLRLANRSAPSACNRVAAAAAPVEQAPNDGAVQAQPGDLLQIGLDWRARQRPAANYTVFVQLLDAGGQVKAQRDRWPGDGLYPTAAMTAGHAIADHLALPLDVPPGTYRLIAGLYRNDQPGQPRLTGPGGDLVTLAEVVVR